MASIGCQRQRIHTRHQRQIEITVEVRKEGTATRRLPLQAVSQLCRVDVDQQQVALSGEMFRGGFDDLRGVGKMNESVALIDV